MFKPNQGTNILLFVVPGLFFMFFSIPLVGLYLLFSKKENNKLVKFVITIIGGIGGTMLYSGLLK